MPETEPFAPVAAALPELLLLLYLSLAASEASTFTEFSTLIFAFLEAAPAALLLSSREAVNVRMELSYSSDSSSESESTPRMLLLSRSSFEVSGPSRVSENDGGNSGAWSPGSNFRLRMEEVAEAEAECEGDGDWELRERTGAIKCDEFPSIANLQRNSKQSQVHRLNFFQYKKGGIEAKLITLGFYGG